MNFLKNPPLLPCGFPVALWYPKCQQATWHRQMKICIRARVPPALEPHLPALPWHHDELGGGKSGSAHAGRAPGPRAELPTANAACPGVLPSPLLSLALLPRSRFLEFLTPEPAHPLLHAGGGQGHTSVGRGAGRGPAGRTPALCPRDPHAHKGPFVAAAGLERSH